MRLPKEALAAITRVQDHKEEADISFRLSRPSGHVVICKEQPGKDRPKIIGVLRPKQTT